jgi:hypothetical protein
MRIPYDMRFVGSAVRAVPGERMADMGDVTTIVDSRSRTFVLVLLGGALGVGATSAGYWLGKRAAQKESGRHGGLV